MAIEAILTEIAGTIVLRSRALGSVADARQEAAIAILQAADTYDPSREGTAAGYFAIVVIRKLLTRLKETQQARRTPLYGGIMSLDADRGNDGTLALRDLVIDRTGYAETAKIRIEAREVWHQIGPYLTRIERRATLLRATGLTYDEIAVRLDIDVKAVDNALRRAHVKFAVRAISNAEFSKIHCEDMRQRRQESELRLAERDADRQCREADRREGARQRRELREAARKQRSDLASESRLRREQQRGEAEQQRQNAEQRRLAKRQQRQHASRQRRLDAQIKAAERRAARIATQVQRQHDRAAAAVAIAAKAQAAKQKRLDARQRDTNQLRHALDHIARYQITPLEVIAVWGRLRDQPLPEIAQNMGYSASLKCRASGALNKVRGKIGRYADAAPTSDFIKLRRLKDGTARYDVTFYESLTRGHGHHYLGTFADLDAARLARDQWISDTTIATARRIMAASRNSRKAA